MERLCKRSESAEFINLFSLIKWSTHTQHQKACKRERGSGFLRITLREPAEAWTQGSWRKTPTLACQVSIQERGFRRSAPHRASREITAFQEKKSVTSHYFMIGIFNHSDWDSETKEGIKTHDRHWRSIAMSSSCSKSNESLLHKFWYKPSLFLCPTTSTKQIGLFRGMLYKISSAKKAIALKAGATWCLHQLYQTLLIAPSPLNAFLKVRFSFTVK